MKKFSFPLHTVLNYKQQVLDNLRNQQAQIISDIFKAEKRIEDLQSQNRSWAQELQERQMKGMTVREMGTYANYLNNLQVREKLEKEALTRLEERKEEKRKEVVAAKTETASIELLKEKKFAQYEYEVQKSEEQFIEEFVSNVRSRTMAQEQRLEMG